MKQILAGIILALAVGSTWASEAESPGYFTSGALYELCDKPANDSSCMMFIMGVMQGMDAQAYLDNSKDQCIPLSDKTNGDFKNIVTGYLASHKNSSSEPAATSVILALGSEECKSKLMPRR